MLHARSAKLAGALCRSGLSCSCSSSTRSCWQINSAATAHSCQGSGDSEGYRKANVNQLLPGLVESPAPGEGLEEAIPRLLDGPYHATNGMNPKSDGLLPRIVSPDFGRRETGLGSGDEASFCASSRMRSSASLSPPADARSARSLSTTSLAAALPSRRKWSRCSSLARRRSNALGAG